ncbi:MAG: AAA domain-containing protein [bacterium]|nr:AAA domain-containing protein [bacterium]
MADDWKIYRGDGADHAADLAKIDGVAPPWRDFARRDQQRATTFRPPPNVVEVVNAALYLRRPVLVTGNPGTGKSSLAYSIAHELGLGKVLAWHINSRSTLRDGLYEYDAVARLRDVTVRAEKRKAQAAVAAKKKGTQAKATTIKREDLGRYVTLGPLGTAFTAEAPGRVVLIDEIDKSDIDLANDLLHVLEDGEFEIPELVRVQDDSDKIDVRLHDEAGKTASVERGRVPCRAFPMIVITNNGERDLPPAFLRRCLRLRIENPLEAELADIVENHLGAKDAKAFEDLIGYFVKKRDQEQVMLATDQLLNTIFLLARGGEMSAEDREKLKAILLRELTSV